MMMVMMMMMMVMIVGLMVVEYGGAWVMVIDIIVFSRFPNLSPKFSLYCVFIVLSGIIIFF